MNIEWKQISFAPDYSVSNTGLVRSESRVLVMKNGRKKTVRQKILVPSKAGQGYLRVQLGSGNAAYVHRLVAMAFIGDPPPGGEVNHKDENKKNNHVDNLEWVSKDYNLKYGTRMARSHANGRKHYHPVIAMKDGQIVAEYSSLREAERHGFNRCHISACCQGKKATHKGFTWAFKSQKEGMVDYVLD